MRDADYRALNVRLTILERRFGSGTAVPGDHATTHYDGGTDPVDLTNLDGYPGGTTTFLRADGTFATPPGTGGSVNALTILQRTTNQSINNATWTSVSWTTTPVQDDVGAFDSGSPTKVTVPAGYTRVRLYVYITWDNNSGGGRYLRWTLNGTADGDTVEIDIRAALNESGAHFATRWYEVAENDELFVMVNQTSGSAINLSGTVFGGPSYVQFEWAP